MANASLRYLGRLWCNLELAAFLKDPENLRRIQFVPLKSTGVLAPWIQQSGMFPGKANSPLVGIVV